MAAASFSLLRAADARADNEVQNLTATQHDGFTTLAWTPVPTATDYQIERTPVDAANAPTGAAVITGVWQPVRHVNPGSPTFADAGYALGGRFQWRVRARFGTTAQGYSLPVFGTTNPQFGTGPGASLRTQWESSGNATYTSDVNEYAYEAALDAASDRVRVVEIGRTNPVTNWPTGRPINLIIIGNPAPPATAAEISNMPAIGVNCSVHGDEPQGREACLIAARMLAFTEDPHMLEMLSNTVVLITPTINQNGRANNTRGNETGSDLNRDHAEIAQPETKAYAAMLRDYTPEIGMDLHEGDTEDLPILSARHLNVFQPLFEEGKNGLIEGWMYNHAALDGWWAGPYSTGGDSHEGILRNTFGLKNAVGMLNESRPAGGTTRPNEGTQLANRNRKSYGGLWEIMQFIEYYSDRRATIHNAVEASIAFNTSNTGRVVLRGSYPWPNFPPVGTGTNGPDVDAPTAARIIDPQPCGYYLTEAQYSGARTGGTVQLRLGLHGIAQETRPTGHIVRLAQPLRGLIPELLDGSAVDPSPILATTRLMQCPYVNPSPRTFSATANEGASTSQLLTIGNDAVEAVGTNLTWTITEAASNCATPSDLPWVSADSTSGLTPKGTSANVSVTFSAAGITGPASRSGVLCLASNDSGEPFITIPLSFSVLDVTAPTTTASLSPAAPTGANGWYLGPVQVTLTATDGDGSGVAQTQYAIDGGAWQTYSGPFSIGSDGSHTVQFASTDVAGNTEATQSITVKVDGNDPVTTATLTPGLLNGWYASPSLTLTGNDGSGSGIAHTDYSLDGGPWTAYSAPLSGFTTGNHFAQYRSTDNAGRVEAVQLIAFKVDAVKPSVNITKPAEGASYPLDKPVAAAFKCTDKESGVDTCAGTVANGANVDTSTVGDHTFTVTGTDKAGNQTVVTHHYTVTYTWNGYFAPVTNTETSKLNLVHAGDLIKLGFGLNGDRGLGVFKPGFPSSHSVECPGWSPHSVPAAGAGSTAGLSYGVASGHYTYGWQTSAAWAGTCRQFDIQLNDGTSTLHSATFMFFA